MSIEAAAKFTLDATAKQFFFGPDSTHKLITDEKVAKVLSKAGGTVRLIAIRSMRFNKRGTPSPEGSPPRSHVPSGAYASLRNILYFYDPAQKKVIVGPRKTNQLGNVGGTISRGTVPAVQEFGGTIGLREMLIPFTLMAAYQRYGRATGDAFKAAGLHMSETDAKRIWKKEASHRIDHAAGGTWIPVGRQKRRQIITRVRQATYPGGERARKFMKPALDKYLPKLPQEFAGMVGTT